MNQHQIVRAGLITTGLLVAVFSVTQVSDAIKYKADRELQERLSVAKLDKLDNCVHRYANSGVSTGYKSRMYFSSPDQVRDWCLRLITENTR